MNFSSNVNEIKADIHWKKLQFLFKVWCIILICIVLTDNSQLGIFKQIARVHRN